MALHPEKDGYGTRPTGEDSPHALMKSAGHLQVRTQTSSTAANETTTENNWNKTLSKTVIELIK